MRRLNPTGLGKKGGLHLAASRSLRAESSKLSAPERTSHQGISKAQEIAVVSACLLVRRRRAVRSIREWPPGATSPRGHQDGPPGVPRASRLSSPVQAGRAPLKG